jgi:hypothetical protein
MITTKLPLGAVFGDVTPIFKDKNRMHKRLICAPGIGHTHKLTNYNSIITVLII